MGDTVDDVEAARAELLRLPPQVINEFKEQLLEFDDDGTQWKLERLAIFAFTSVSKDVRRGALKTLQLLPSEVWKEALRNVASPFLRGEPRVPVAGNGLRI